MPKVVDHAGRRAAVAEATIRVVAERGVAGATIREISREVGCTSGLLSHYFRNRDELILFAMQRATEVVKHNLDAANLAEEDPRARLTELCVAALPTEPASAAAWQVWLHAMGHALLASELRESLQSMMGRARERMTGAIRAARDAGTLSADTDPEIEADRLLALLDGVCVDATLDPQHYTPRRQREIIEGHLRRVFG